MTLRTKFGLFTGLLILAAMAAFATLDYFHQKNLIERSLSKEHAAQVETFVSLCRQALTVDNELFMVNYVRLLETSPGVSYAYFADEKGKITVHSDIHFINKTLSDWKRPSDVLEVSAPVLLGAQKTGSAVIGFSQEYQRRLLTQSLDRALKQVAATATALASLGIALALLFAYMLTRPLKDLARKSEQIAKGNFNSEVRVTSADEVGQLAQRFNSMARSLAALDELKDEFISSVSHDLRNPLSAIYMYSEFMLNQDKDKDHFLPKHRDFLSMIMDNTKRLGMFVNNILDAAKIKAGRMQYHPQGVRLQAVAQRIQKLFGIMAQQRQILLMAEIPLDLAEALADPEHIEQVLANLFSNAIKFTPNGGRITLSGREQDGRIEIAVADTGKGIAPADLAQLFQRFGQFGVAEQKAQGVKGTGLGLYIVKKSVEDMAGTIRVESELGKGSRFMVSLPKAPAKSRMPAATPVPVPRTNPGHAPSSPKILVVDDEPYFASFAKMLLDSYGYRTVVAPDEERALSLASSEKPDLVLLDLALPGIGGAEVLRKLKSDPATAGTPVVLCSISKSPQEIDAVMRLGAEDFLPKPLNADDLKQKLAKALAKAPSP